MIVVDVHGHVCDKRYVQGEYPVNSRVHLWQWVSAREWGGKCLFLATRANECLTDLLFSSRQYQRVSKSF